MTSAVYSVLSVLLVVGLCLPGGLGAHASTPASGVAGLAAFAKTEQDTTPIRDRDGDFLSDPNPNLIDLRDPTGVTQEVEYDPITDRYIVTERIGDDYFRSPTYLTFDEYQAYRERQERTAYFDRLNGVSTGSGVGATALDDPIEAIDVENSLIDRLFGGREVTIQPRGNVDLTFGIDYRSVENPSFTVRQQRQTNFDFDMAIQMNVTGSIGTKLNLSSSYNSTSNFNFDRQLIKISYDAASFGDDEILRNIEFGNVSLPLRSSLIQGSQGLFGVRADLQFGDLKVTALASQQKTKRDAIEIQGGAQFQEFEVRADEYDENRHFLLSHFNRDQFEKSLKNLPTVNALFKINRIEVWITNDRDQTESVRELAALADLGESERITNTNPDFQLPESPRYRAIDGSGLPDNEANPLYAALTSNDQFRFRENVVSTLEGPRFDFRQATDFERVRARLLSPTEYTFHPELGFISVNVNVRPDQVLAAAYEYTYNGQVYKVGEFSNDLPVGDTSNLNVLFTRLLKSTTPRVDVPTWDLMMKNFYNIGAFQVNREDFRLDITYEDPGGGEKRFLPSSNLQSKPLIQVFGLDTLNVQLDPGPDGIFDFVSGLTIYPNNGRIMFPVLEPFGRGLTRRIDDPGEQAKYDYKVLYDSTVIRAREYPEFNRFLIRGSYKSEVSSEISLGAFNIPRGSVKVTAGGQVLREGQDYDIDYNIGRIKILNDAYLNSGVPLQVSFEDNAVFGLQRRTMVGLRGDYQVNPALSVGATYLHLFEAPYTQKVNVGDDPINNRIVGLDLVYGDEAPWLTRFVDKIPGISTKEPSSINLSAEAAFLKPGHARAIEVNKNDGGVVYVDDFEGSASGFDLKTPINAWTLASVPQNDTRNSNDLFPEGALPDTTLSNVNRAMLNWYRIDAQARRGIDGSNQEPYSRPINPQELYPLRQQNQFNNTGLFTFDLSYYPQERGPYNFDLPGGTEFSAGLGPSGGLENPEERWGGIMRQLTTNDFQAANIEYIEFWVMSPFLEGRNTEEFEGDLYFEFGNISEDLMRDSRLFFENGLPAGENANGDRPVDLTSFGRVPRSAPITQAFDNDPAARRQQDIGFDGLNDEGEAVKFASWLAEVRGSVTGPGLLAIEADPANDNFLTFTEDAQPNASSVLERYKRFNGPEGNSPAAEGNSSTAFSTLPDTEDLNGDNTLSENESYFQYKVEFRSGGSGRIADNPYITEVREVQNPDGRDPTFWYRFKVPLDDFSNPNVKRVGGIQDFRSIRFMRMYLKGFESPVTFRFARLDLVRNQWRRYLRVRDLVGSGADVGIEDRSAFFDVDAINIEENSTRQPINYVVPPGIVRELQNQSLNNALQNEQSQVMTVCDLEDGKAQAIYKIVNLDMRVFERLQMFVHAQENDTDDQQTLPRALQDGDMTMFVRLGSDFQNNYYEYELPLSFTRITGDAQPTAEEVWPTANDIDISLKALIALKSERNQSERPIDQAFSMPNPDDPTRTIRIVGNPNLGLVKGVMIGLRNPSDGRAESICAQVWINELRLNGLDERGGAAGLARLDAQLADFGTVSASGAYSTIGWGGLDQKLAERARESSLVYDITTSVELGKFLPEKSGIRIPATGVYSNNVRRPEYDPYDLDIKLKDKLEAADRDTVKALREQAVDRTVQREINFTNVRKERTKRQDKPYPWDISNFSVSYVYNETDRTNPLIELDETVNHYGALDYAYTTRPKYIEPLKKAIKNDEYFNLLRELNFNLLPNRFGFSTTMDRTLQSTRYRFAGDDPRFTTFFNRTWTWDRDYTFNWDLSRGLRFQFNATNRAVIDELPTYTEDGNFIEDQERKDFVVQNLRDFGRNKAYQHRFDLNYTLPTKQIPYLDWVGVTAQYAGTYNWNAAALNLDSLGNVITNGNQRQVRGDLNFEQLYRRSKYLQKIEAPRQPKKKGAKGEENEDQPFDDVPDVDEGDEDEDEDGKKKKKKRDRQPTLVERALIRPLLSLRRGNVSYSEDYGTTLPGWIPSTEYLGLSPGFDQPGWEFIGGVQPDIRGTFGQPQDQDYLYQRRQYFSNAITLNQQVYQTYSQNLTGQLSLEPFKDFRVDLDFSQQFTENHSEFFKDTLVGEGESFARLVPTDIGSYTITYGAVNTLFGDLPEDLFATFEGYRTDISQRLNPDTRHANDTLANQGYAAGYGPTQQDVLLPAFIAAYTKQAPGSVKLDWRQARPKPNWRLTYNGLARLKGFDNVFASLAVTHSYKSTLTVNSFNTNLDYNIQAPRDTSNIYSVTSNYYAKLVIPDLVISEQFAPLIGLDARLKNEMSVRASLSKSRSLGMSFVDNQLAERNSTEWSVGYGYTLKNVDLLQYFGGKKRRASRRQDDAPDEGDDTAPDGRKRRNNNGGTVGNDLDIQVDIRYSNDATINRQLDQESNVPTRGSRNIVISPSAEYEINRQLSLRFFVDYRRTDPRITTSFPTVNTNGGVTVRFKLE